MHSKNAPQVSLFCSLLFPATPHITCTHTHMLLFALSWTHPWIGHIISGSDGDLAMRNQGKKNIVFK